MKRTTTLLLFGLMALAACRKDKYDPLISQYDDDQINAYIKANGLTGMTRDTSGIYYKLTDPGKGAVLVDTSNVDMVFTVKSIDNKYVSADSIANHYDGFLGHISTTTSPLGLGTLGLEEAVRNLVNRNGAIARVIIPSRLAFGVSGAGVGSSSNTAGRIAGNQCLDYYVHIIGDVTDQYNYDQFLIKKYIADNNLTNMKQDPAGYWYGIDEPGLGNVSIDDNSSILVTYTAQLINGTIASQSNNSILPAPFDVPDLIPGVRLGLEKYGSTGVLLTFLFPSTFAYGKATTSIPPNSVLRYDTRIISISN